MTESSDKAEKISAFKRLIQKIQSMSGPSPSEAASQSAIFQEDVTQHSARDVLERHASYQDDPPVPMSTPRTYIERSRGGYALSDQQKEAYRDLGSICTSILTTGRHITSDGQDWTTGFFVSDKQDSPRHYAIAIKGRPTQDTWHLDTKPLFDGIQILALDAMTQEGWWQVAAPKISNKMIRNQVWNFPVNPGASAHFPNLPPEEIDLLTSQIARCSPIRPDDFHAVLEDNFHGLRINDPALTRKQPFIPHILNIVHGQNIAQSFQSLQQLEYRQSQSFQ